MITRVDRSAGVAAFRKGRSLCLRLHGTLNARMVRAAAAMIREDVEAVRLRLECSTVKAADAPAVAALADALLAWGGAAAGRSVELHNLDAGLQERVGWHPLRAFLDPDELVFFDPDRGPVWTDPMSRR